MNRFNFGNQITNGTQILSVAGRTYAGDVINQNRRKINDITSGLNNLSEDEQTQYGKFRADKIRQQMNDFYGSGESSNSNSENIKSKTSADNVRNIEIDDSMISSIPNKQPNGKENLEPIEPEWEKIDGLLGVGFENNSEQFRELNTKIDRDTKWLDRYNSNIQNLPTRRF